MEGAQRMTLWAVGVLGAQDDVVVPTEDSGLIGKAKHVPDAFSNWKEDSTKNRDLLFGSARRVMSEKYMGLADNIVPLPKVHDMVSVVKPRTRGQDGLADLMFGSWNQGFHKPHDKTVHKAENMFDQPYRQHMAAAAQQGHQVFKAPKPDLYPTVGKNINPRTSPQSPLPLARRVSPVREASCVSLFQMQSHSVLCLPPSTKPTSPPQLPNKY